MRFLLDTNVLIPLEDSSKLLEQPLETFISRAFNSKHSLLYHEATIKDIERDKNPLRRKRSLQTLKKYEKISNHRFHKEEINNVFGNSKSDNDWCDNIILHSLFRNCVDFLITEDIGIHRKAKLLGLSERVLYIQQASNFLEETFTESNFQFPGIMEDYVSNIKDEQPIFESLNETYPEFFEWLNKVKKQARKYWAISSYEEKIEAILIFKEELNPLITIDNRGLPGKTLKMCTFKVAPLARGKHYGELLLKKAFDTAFKRSLSHVYVTIREKEQPHLRHLLESNGFFLFGKKASSEGNLDDIYVKTTFPAKKDNALPSLDFAIKFYPHFKLDSSVDCFCIPIQPKYHRHLFPEIQLQHELIGQGAIVGNAIRQAYICNSNINQVKPSSLVFFYRSKDYREITTYGIVEQVERTKRPSRAYQLTRKRTIYSNKDIENLCTDGALILLFRVLGHLDKPVSREQLQDWGVRGNTQSIRKLSTQQAKNILSSNEKRNYFPAN